MQFPGGWLSLENSRPIAITNIITYSALFDGSSTIKGKVLMSGDYNSPTGGSWVNSPITINSEPTVLAVDAANDVTQQVIADSMNMQTQMANLSASVAPPLKNLVYMYANQGNLLRYMSEIELNLGGSNYNLFQISILENVATRGDEHGNIQVVDFGSGPFTGVVKLQSFFSENHGPINLGIRLESTTNQSSIFELKLILLSPNQI